MKNSLTVVTVLKKMAFFLFLLFVAPKLKKIMKIRFGGLLEKGSPHMYIYLPHVRGLHTLMEGGSTVEIHIDVAIYIYLCSGFTNNPVHIICYLPLAERQCTHM